VVTRSISSALEEDLQNEEYVDLFGDNFLVEIARKYGVSTQAL